MEQVQKDSILSYKGMLMKVEARLENLVFTRDIKENGALGPVSPATDLEDLETFGWRVE